MICSTVSPPMIDRRCPADYAADERLHLVLLRQEAAGRIGD
jgi:hypothetical protein